jgi:hypothetical protein
VTRRPAAVSARRRLAVPGQEVPGRLAAHGEQAAALDADSRAAKGLTQHRQSIGPAVELDLQIEHCAYLLPGPGPAART